MKLTFDEMYNAIGRNESRYEGLFITAVKSTNIFCRPSCRARKPLAKNVTFFSTAEEALKSGFRPCKVCRPMEVENETPLHIRSLINQVHRSPFLKIRDWDIKEMGLEPSQVRRWFKKNHKMTFQCYQRLVRLNTGFSQIQGGKKVVDAALDAGYESLSGFSDGFKAVFGAPPKRLGNVSVVLIDRFSSKLGPMFIAATSSGICLAEFTDRKMLETELKDLKKRLGAVIAPGCNHHIELAKKELTEYFNGCRKTFSVGLDTPGTEFQQKVWLALQKIPFGSKASYRDQARMIESPKAVRAVANANGMNRVSILIPCHRVIGSDGSLTGYGGGLPRKKWLLAHEEAHS